MVFKNSKIIANRYFKNYQELKKKKLREEQKIPRKIIRQFINCCKSSEIDGIIKTLPDNIVYERRINWQSELRIEGLKSLSNSSNLQIKMYVLKTLKSGLRGTLILMTLQ